MFYIAEGPSFSAGEILLALFILLFVLASLVFVVIVGVKGFLRLGRGRRDSLPVKLTPIIAVLDVLLALAVYDESLTFAFAPLVIHGVAFLIGATTKPVEGSPPPEPQTPTGG